MATKEFNLPGQLGGSIGHDFITLPARGEGVSGSLLFATDQTEEFISYIKLLDYASTLALKIPIWLKSATSPSTVEIDIEIMAIESGVAGDVNVADFDAVNSSGGITVPATAGDPKDVDISCSNDDSPSGASPLFLIRFSRDHDGSDNAPGDMGIGPFVGAVGSYVTT
jgi:hypothetical protein